MAYLPLDVVGATIFQLVSARYEWGSIVLTSNKSYGEWGSIFGEPIITTAILDRLLHQATTANICRESYRLKERRKAGLLAPPAWPDTSQEGGPATLACTPGPLLGFAPVPVGKKWILALFS
jgi:IstB-like ATP binding protein